MAREFFKNLPNTTTPLTAPRINGLLDGDEAIGNIIVDSINTKNMISGWFYGGLEATDGSENDNSNSRRTGFIEVDFSTTTNYYVSGMPASSTSIRHFIAAYNTSMQFLGRTGGNLGSTENLTSSSFTSGTPQGTGTIKYLRVVLYSGATDNDTTTVQLEKGSSSTTFAEGKALGYISGSTANGDYIKYDDGTLICWNRITYSESVAVTTSSGALYRSSAITPFPNYPYTFIEAPAVSFEYLSDTGNHFLWIVKANSATATAPRGIYLFCPTSNTCSDVVLSYIAIGRWK